MSAPIDFNSTTAHKDQQSFSIGGNRGIQIGAKTSPWVVGAGVAAVLALGVWLWKSKG